MLSLFSPAQGSLPIFRNLSCALVSSIPYYSFSLPRWYATRTCLSSRCHINPNFSQCSILKACQQIVCLVLARELLEYPPSGDTQLENPLQKAAPDPPANLVTGLLSLIFSCKSSATKLTMSPSYVSVP